MRLLKTDTVETVEFAYGHIPPYAILSHRWGREEVTLQDVVDGHMGAKEGLKKVKNFCSRAKKDNYEYAWIDTCCIDKTSSAELSEAINSMYLWYYQAERCYVYLADVPSKSPFEASQWFTRGWTLQELLAPSQVYFLDEHWDDLGTKDTLQQLISSCTAIPVDILSGDVELETASVAQRMSWAARRETTRPEDLAYSLMGIFGINMPLLYGEGDRAFIRLQEEIMKVSDDHSLFAWEYPDCGGLLAPSPAAFNGSRNIVQFHPFDAPNSTSTVSCRGVHLDLRLVGCGPQGLGLAILHCKEQGSGDGPIAIYVKDLLWTMERFERVQSEKLERLNLGKFRYLQYPIRKICIRSGRLMPTRKSSENGNTGNTMQYTTYDDKTLVNLMGATEPTALLRAAQAGNKDDVWLLLTRSGVEVDVKDSDGRTALSWAAEKGCKTIVKLLLENGADVDAKDNNSHMPLWQAVVNAHDHVAKLLLEHGAEVDYTDSDRRTPLWWAARNGHMTVVKLLIDEGARVECKDIHGQTPLLCSSSRGDAAIAKLLIENGACIHAKDEEGQSALWRAAAKGHAAVARLLLEKGSIINCKDHIYGHTPLWRAASEGYEAVVRVLLEHGAEVDAKDKYGETALSQVKANGQDMIAKLLLEHGAEVEMEDEGDQTSLW